MKYILHKIVLLLLLFGTAVVYGQQGKIKKAAKAYDNYGYIDAQKIYLKVAEDGYHSAEIYKKLGDTYYFNGDYANASTWYGRLLSEFPEAATADYYFRSSQSYRSIGSYEEADALIATLGDLKADSLLVKNYKSNPNYLADIKSQSGKYSIYLSEINSSYSDFSPSFYKENQLVYATANTTNKVHDWNNQPFFNLYVADRNAEGKLSNSRELGGDINTKLNESSTVFTKDGNTVYFTRNNFLKGKKGKDKERTIRHKLYKAIKTADNSWGHVEELPFNNDSFSVAHPALNAEENRLYFSSDMPGTRGMSDLWYVDILADNHYGTPVNLGIQINTEARESFPFIDKDNVLYFASDGRAGLGGLDIFYTPLNEAGLPTAIHTFGAPVNSNKDDFGWIIDKESKSIYFASNRSEGTGQIDDNIYLVKEICEITLEGVITDIDTGALLPGSLVALLDKDNKNVQQVTVGTDATYHFVAGCDSQYTLRVSKEDYETKDEVVKTPDTSAEINLPIALKTTDPCPADDLGCRLSLQPIYFDFDKFNIRRDAEIELAKILIAMQEYPQLKIHIESHTDSRGNDAYNELLSERRAQSTMQWLLGKGISKDRLTAKGYGETRLINQCSNDVPCTEQAHQLNRRSMFIIKQ